MELHSILRCIVMMTRYGDNLETGCPFLESKYARETASVRFWCIPKYTRKVAGGKFAAYVVN